MMTNIEEFIKEIEPKLNERDKKVKERKELIKDINDFCELLPALNQVIEELQRKYSQERNVKEELDSYLKERDLYWQTIQEFRKRAEEIKMELEEQETITLPEKLIDLSYKRHSLILELRSLERESKGKENLITYRNESQELVEISSEVAQMYENALKKLAQLEENMQVEYQKLLELEPIMEENEDQDFMPPINDTLNTHKKEELEEERQRILEEIKKMEQKKGKKCPLKYTLEGIEYHVKIPRRLKGKYKALLTKLYQTEKFLKDYIPPVKFEKELYETMTEAQRMAYLANIMLQIEARSEKTINKYTINGKTIPYEYKELYEEVLDYLAIEKQRKAETFVSVDIEHAMQNNEVEDFNHPFLTPVNLEEEQLKEAQEAYKKYQVVVTHKRTASNPNNVKSQLKRKIIPIALAVGTTVVGVVAGLSAFQKYMPPKEKLIVENKIESLQNNEEVFIKVEDNKPSITPEQSTKSVQSVSTPESQENTDWKEVNNFTLNQEEDVPLNIYQGDLQKPMKPKYPNDSYRIVTRNYRMPNGEIMQVKGEDELAKSEMEELEALGGVLETVDAVAKTGEEDYKKNKIPTGRFVIDNSLTPNSIELDTEILEYLNGNEGRGR